MKKLLKKTIYIIPLIIAVALVVGIATGKLDKGVNKAKHYVEESKEDKGASSSEDNFDKTNSDISSETDDLEPEKEIPAGKINLLEYFTWIGKPKVEVFDPENRIIGERVYGMTKEEEKYSIELEKKQEEYNKANPIPKELKGILCFNKDRLLDYGESYYIEEIKTTVTYSNFEVRDNFNGLESKYFTEHDIDREEFIKKLDADGKLSNCCYYKYYGGNNGINDVKVENVDYRLVMFDINLKCDCEWVVEKDVVPWLYYLEEVETGKALTEVTPRIYGETGQGNGNVDIAYFLPKYLDIVDNMPELDEDPRFYPMRKGDDITFRVGYIVPVDYMDKAYLIFDKNGNYNTNTTEYSYNTQNYILMKLIQ